MDYDEKLREIRSRHDEEHELIKALIEEVKELKKQRSAEKMEKEEAIAAKKHYFEMMVQYENRVKEVQSSQDKKPHVMVLVDGDGLTFRDEFVSRGEKGGRDAGRLLIQETKAYVKTLQLKVEVSVVIRIFCNMKGLDNSFRSRKILTGNERYDTFARGVNKSGALIDVVDAGDGKECADNKIRSNFESSVDNVHCKHVIFGGSTDNGYARMLDPASDDEIKRKLVTLLEGPPFEKELRDLVPRFSRTRFEPVFRSEKMSSAPNGHITSPATYAKASSVPGHPGSPSVYSNGHTSPNIIRSDTSEFQEHRVLVNRYGQRVDRPLKKVPDLQFHIVKKMKYCNLHHLSQCPYINCNHHHGDKLTGDAKEALRKVARLSPCKSGTACKDPKCLSGHSCPYEKDEGHDARTCRWITMHDIDQKTV